MPDYSKGKIYKLQCDDGYFYIGSTCNELRYRLHGHKQDSRDRTTRVYQHINEIGWNCVRIVLIEEFPCENKQALVRKEDEYVRNHKNDSFCLNVRNANETKEEKQERHRITQQGYVERNRQRVRDRNNQYHEEHREQILQRKREAYAKKKLYES